MCLGLQTVSLVERCPLFRMFFIERFNSIPSPTTSDKSTSGLYILYILYILYVSIPTSWPHAKRLQQSCIVQVYCTFESVHSWQCSPLKPDSRSHLHLPHSQVPWPEQGDWDGNRRDWRKGSGGEKRKGKGVKRGRREEWRGEKVKSLEGEEGRKGEETKGEGSEEGGGE